MKLATHGRAFTLAATGLAIAAMVTLVSFSVPLYRLFCAATGAGGTTTRVASDTAALSHQRITVFFNTDVAPGLPWHFEPVQRSVTIQLGEQVPVWFTATNESDRPIVGHATFNVTPDKAGRYFKKIQCFCFTEEKLAPHQRVQMPVQFYVDPAMAQDPGAADVHQITLSYTFFESKRPAKAQDLARLAAAPPDPARGQQVFAAQCSACHALNAVKIGPPLAGVVGRRAGSVAGYGYTAALARSDRIWTPAALEGWLIDPQADVPGTAMPLSLGSAADRRDVVAYLATVAPTASR